MLGIVETQIHESTHRNMLHAIRENRRTEGFALHEAYAQGAPRKLRIRCQQKYAHAASESYLLS
jgi:hypothetical protein